jgi:hypothetical protein
MNLKNIFTLAIFIFFIFQNYLYSQDAIDIKRIEGSIDFDGQPFESAWNNLNKFNMVMHRPNFGNDPSERSEIMIGYDDNFLWFGARLYMDDASQIKAVTKKRDEMLFDYDAIGILIDTYNDNENGLAFFTTPTGSRTDYTISNDAAGGGNPFESFNYSWNTFWDVKTYRDEKGWYTEIRIPFSSLKFKPENDLSTMGLIIARNISAHNETDTYPAIDPKYGFMATNKPSLATSIRFKGVRPENPVYVSPYAITGFSRDWPLNEAGDEYVKEDKKHFNAGLDVKYNINSNLTLDLTANTDFAQVEADDQQVNLTRYSLFFPEKRMFFQERSSIFSFSLGGFSDNLFYSRDIGISNGNPVRIYGGARLTGRIGNWDLGFLDMQTEEYEDNPSENFGVLRMRRQVINQNSYIGGVFTSRLGMNGDQNFAYGLDGIFRLFGDDYLNVKWAQTYDSDIGNKMTSLDPSFILINWERRSEEGFAYNFNYTYSGCEFNPGIGFVRRGGVQGFNTQLLYGWIPGEKSPFFNYSVFVRADRYSRIEDGQLEGMSVEPGFEFNTKNNLHAEISLEYQEEGVGFEFPISDSISIAEGNYRFTGIQMRIGTSEAKMISLRGNINAGQFYDGNRYGFESETNFKFSSSFNISAGYEFNALRFPDRATNNSLNIHSVNSRAEYMFSTKLSATILVQYVNTEDEMITNFRLRYNPREGNDFYLVFNDFRALTGDNEIPALPSYFNRTFMVKYTHTFIF